jgi:hypothetical protein
MHAPPHHDDGEFKLKDLTVLLLLIVLSWSIAFVIGFAVMRIVLAMFFEG